MKRCLAIKVIEAKISAAIDATYRIKETWHERSKEVQEQEVLLLWPSSNDDRQAD